MRQMLPILTLMFGPAILATAASEKPEAQPAVYSPLEGFENAGAFGPPAVLKDGRVFTWYVRGKTPGDFAQLDNPDIPQQCFGRYSEDGGRTWSEPRLLFEFPREKGTRLVGATLFDRDGVLHIFGMNDFWDGKTFDPAKIRCDVWQATSSNSGATWSAVRRVEHAYLTPGWINGVIQLKRGRILIPLGHLTARATGKFVGSCIYSDDGGATWRTSTSNLVVDSGHGDFESGACEMVAAELEDGRVWMLLRTQTGYLYESFSQDGGATWGKPTQSRFADTNTAASLLRLRDGRIILLWNNCSFGNLKDFRGDRAVLNAAISADDGKTWQGYREIARVNVSSVLAYPYMTELSDGTVLVWVWAGGQMRRLDPNWLTAAAMTDDFSRGLAEWSVAAAEGVSIADHPDKSGRKVLLLGKTNPQVAAAAVRNFPFGVRGRLTLALCTQPGFNGTRICLTDFYSLPPIERKGRFGVHIAPDGRLFTTGGDGEDVPSEGVITPGKWVDLTFVWDCTRKQCTLLLDGKRVAEIWQLLAPDLAEYPPNMADGQKAPEARGLCYLRLWSNAEGTDDAGLMVESMKVRAEP